MVVLDASVVAKLLVEEPGSDTAHDLLTRTTTRHAPELVLAEVGNMLGRRVRLGTTPAAEAPNLLRVISAIVTHSHSLSDLAVQALALSIAHRHPIYDCFYVALALREVLPLATADRRLSALATEEGVAVISIGPG